MFQVTGKNQRMGGLVGPRRTKNMVLVHILNIHFLQNLMGSNISGKSWTPESKIKKWDEVRVTDATTGVKREDIPLFLEMLKESVNLPSPSLSNKFGQILQQLTTDCKSGGLTSTVYGNLDRKTAMYGLFHCVKEPED